MNGTTILFGLPGVAVDGVHRDGEGARTVRVVTDDPGASACPACGVFSTSVKQRRVTRPKDLPYGEAPLGVRWHKTQYRCRETVCERKAFTESIAELPPRARVTGRCRRAAARAVGSGRSVAAVTGELPMSWPVVHAAFVAHADRLLTEPLPVSVLGIDETRRGRPRWTKNLESGRWERLDRFETNFVDLQGDQGLLGQTAGRTSKAVVDWLDERGEEWKATVEVVAMDPCSAYRHAVSKALPNARIVADHFRLALVRRGQPFARFAANRAMGGRNRSRTDPSKGRFTPADTAGFVRAAFERFERQVPSLPREPTVGSRQNVMLAALTLSLLEALEEAGIERSYGIELVGDTCWRFYRHWGRVTKAVSSLVSQDPARRLRLSVNAFLVYPFGRPGYRFDDEPEPDGRSLDMLRCPVADYLGQRDAADLCASSWCNLDYALAEMWGARLERSGTLVSGDARCDFRFHTVPAASELTVNADRGRAGAAGVRD